MTLVNKIKIVSLFLLIIGFSNIFAQTEEYDTWDNQIYLGNKIAFGKNKWHFSGELQTRLRNNFRSLDNWYVEFVADYLVAKNIEIVPDFRYTIKPNKTEIRPGFGILYKINRNKYQFVNQLKWQTDFGSDDNVGHAFREVIFSNYKINDQLVATLVAGFIYRWWPGEWDGFQYIRTGPGISYIFDEKHILNFSYFVGVENKRDYWLWAGIPMVQLVINVAKKEEYTSAPAYYFDF